MRVRLNLMNAVARSRCITQVSRPEYIEELDTLREDTKLSGIYPESRGFEDIFRRLSGIITMRWLRIENVIELGHNG